MHSARERLIAAAMVVALSLVLVLAYQNHALMRRQGELRDRLTRPTVGMYVPAFNALGTSGEPMPVGAPRATRFQLIFVLNSRCPWCARSIPQWNEIAQSLGSRLGNSNVDIVGLSRDSLAEASRYSLRTTLSFPLGVFPDRRTMILTKATAVPATLLINSSGRVVYAHVGAVIDGSLRDTLAILLGSSPSDQATQTAASR